ncbi:MAG: alpha-L-fucosidase [Clostridia bacterium]|nr:alpha-L-fucosidase [Clostridia bacterium]
MNNKAKWFRESKWGVFSHYLYNLQNSDTEKGMLHSKGIGNTDWNQCVEDFDTDQYANILNDIGAGYVIFTIMQGNKYLCSPNATYNEITGYKQGEACSSRDLIADLIQSLNKYDIPLMLYYTGDGPHQDEIGGHAFGFYDRENQNVSDEFVTKWASVAQEFSLRYKSGVKGWWIDGCYKDFFGYDESKLKILSDAVKAGNPNAIVTFNNGVDFKGRYSIHEDFTAGEVTEFTDDYPNEEQCDGSQPHLLSFLGIPSEFYEWGNPAWGKPGSKYSGEFMSSYVNKVNNAGGVVSIDVCTFRDGTIDQGQIEVLRYLSKINI